MKSINFEITRGDAVPFKFQRENDAGDIITTRPKNLWFTVKKSANSSIVLIQKRLSNGTIVYDEEMQCYRFALLPSDTNGLEIGGEYYYDIEVMTAEGPKTIAKGKLLITYEVTHAADEVMDDG